MSAIPFPSLPLIVEVERRIGPILGPHVFVGGSCVGFYIRDHAIPALRPTEDIDLTVEVNTRIPDYANLEAALRRANLENDHNLICRWHMGAISIDIMPTDGDILSFTNAWYPEALRSRQSMAWDGLNIPYPNVWAFLATKIEAFLDRGKGDFAASHDFEDIVRVIDGNAELIDSASRASPAVRRFVGQTVAEWHGSWRLADGVNAHLIDDGQGGRIQIVRERLNHLIRIGAS